MEEQNALGEAARAAVDAAVDTAQSDEELCDVKLVTKSYEQPVENKSLAVDVTKLPTKQRGSMPGQQGVPLKVAERAAFADWIALTGDERKLLALPETQRAMAERLNVTEGTLSHWKAEPEFQREVTRLLRARCQRHAPAIIDKMNEKALAGEGDVPAARTVLEHAMPDEKPGMSVIVPVSVTTEVLVGGADEDAPLPEWTKVGNGEREVIEAEVIDVSEGGAIEKGGEDAD